MVNEIFANILGQFIDVTSLSVAGTAIFITGEIVICVLVIIGSFRLIYQIVKLITKN